MSEPDDDFRLLIQSIHEQALRTWEYSDSRMPYVSVQIAKADLPTVAEGKALVAERDHLRAVADAARRFLRAESVLHRQRKMGASDDEMSKWVMVAWANLVQLVDRWDGREPFEPLSEEEIQRVLAEARGEGS